MVRDGLSVCSPSPGAFPAGSASAATCIYQGGNLGSSHEPLHWDCGHVPGAGDSAVVPPFTEVSVAADASAGGLFLGGPASALTFSNEATLAAGTLTAASATLRGEGTVAVAGGSTRRASPIRARCSSSTPSISC